MASALTRLHESQAFESANCLLARTLRSLGKLCLENGYHRPALSHAGKFFQVKLCGFSEVCNCFLDGGPLAHSSHFRAFRDVEFAFLVQNGGEGCYGHVKVSWLILPVAVQLSN